MNHGFKSIFSLIFALCALSMAAQESVVFEFDPNDGYPEGAPVKRMESNISKLLTAMNNAAVNGSNTIDFSGIDITDDASFSLMMTWENVHMRTFDDDIVQKCVALGYEPNVRGYEVQNIGVEMMPLNNDYKEARSQEITITLDKQGRITDFVISMGMHQYSNMMKGAKTLEDIDQRTQILHFVEQFRTAYCEKNKTFLEDVFSDDALIITGRVRQRVNLETGALTTVVDYNKQTKREYLTRLFQKFDTPNSYINVKFDDIEVEHTPTNPDIYGVTVRQEWYSNNYSDVGTVFLLWDFSNKKKPKIYVRTWQPNEDTHRFSIKEFNF